MYVKPINDRNQLTMKIWRNENEKILNRSSKRNMKKSIIRKWLKKETQYSMKNNMIWKYLNENEKLILSNNVMKIMKSSKRRNW